MADDDADPLDWELEQLQKLKRLAQAYGWGGDHSQYKAKLKGIQAQGKERLSAALRKKQGGEKKKAGSIIYLGVQRCDPLALARRDSTDAQGVRGRAAASSRRRGSTRRRLS